VKIWIVAAALAATVPVSASHGQGDTAAALFGARDGVIDISLSPDGKSIAIVRPMEGRGAALFVVDLGAPELKPILTSTGDPDHLSHCSWSSNTRLICGVRMIQLFDGKQYYFTRLVALNSDGSNVRQLSAREKGAETSVALGGGNVIDWVADGEPGTVLLARYFPASATTGTMLAQTHAGYGVERVNTITLARQTVEQPNGYATDYISDGRGNVRIMGIQPSTNAGRDGNRIEYSYRQAGSRKWLPLATAMIVGGDRLSGFRPVAVDPDLNIVYGFDSQNGHQALFKVALDGSLKRELVFERPDVDVTGLMQIGRQQRVVGTSYITDKSQTSFFDASVAALTRSLGKALPGRELTILDASVDETKLLLWAGSDVNPGDFYLFDRSTKRLQEVMPARPELADTKLAEVTSITFPAADGTMIPAYLTLPPGSNGKGLSAIVMPHGGPSSRDVWGFDWLPQYFANRGYAVLQPNYRGSSGYGDAWFGKNGFQSWKIAIGDVNDAGHWLVKQGIADPNKLGIFGWSYGGYAALQSPVLDPTLFKAIVAVAPVTDLSSLIEEHRDLADLPQVQAQVGSGPHLVQGSPARNADRIKVPVLMFHGDHDLTVSIAESRLMRGKLKSVGANAELVEFDGLDHQLDDNVARTQLLGKADSFLRAALKM
jgi:dipeptidyl aminopeptidase/acylaminoacyl peptidase